MNCPLEAKSSGRCGHPTTSESIKPAPRTSTHPIVGNLDLTFEAMELTADHGLLLLAYTAAPGSPSHDALQLLANWAATSEPAAEQSGER